MMEDITIKANPEEVSEQTNRLIERCGWDFNYHRKMMAECYNSLVAWQQIYPNEVAQIAEKFDIPNLKADDHGEV